MTMTSNESDMEAMARTSILTPRNPKVVSRETTQIS